MPKANINNINNFYGDDRDDLRSFSDATNTHNPRNQQTNLNPKKANLDKSTFNTKLNTTDSYNSKVSSNASKLGPSDQIML